MVRLLQAKSVQIITDESERSYRKAVEATFLHNDTYLICDTAFWRVDDNIINAKGNVQLMQEGTVLPVHYASFEFVGDGFESTCSVADGNQPSYVLSRDFACLVQP